MVGAEGLAEAVQVAPDTPGAIECSSLSVLLKAKNRTHVDFWSLDVEGYEMKILQAHDFNDVSVDVLLIEDVWVSHWKLDLLMYQSGYYKFQQHANDALFLRRDVRAIDFQHPWYPPTWKTDLEFMMRLRGNCRDVCHI